MSIPKVFVYNQHAYLKVTPGKKLFQSTMVHDVVNRGDIFAVRLSDGLLTIIAGASKVEPISIDTISWTKTGDCLIATELIV